MPFSAYVVQPIRDGRCGKEFRARVFLERMDKDIAERPKDEDVEGSLAE